MENLTEMETTIRLPFQVNEEAFYIKDNQIRKGIIWRVDAEITETSHRFMLWFKKEDKTNDLINLELVFTTKEQAIDYVTSTIK